MEATTTQVARTLMCLVVLVHLPGLANAQATVEHDVGPVAGVPFGGTVPRTVLESSPPSPDAPLGTALTREANRLASSLWTATPSWSDQSAGQSRSWVRRHPVLFGALVGAGAGAVSSIPAWNELYCASGGDEECLFYGAAGVLFGAGVGAGIGAVIGAVAGH